MQASNELQQQQQQPEVSLLSEYGALLMQHCRQIQQVLQGGCPPDALAVAHGDNDDDDSGGIGKTANRLRSALRVLALHSDYSGRFFDLFRVELHAALSLEMSEQARLAQHREASRLLKEVCFRSKEMSHDIIKASRELVHTFKSEQRVEDSRHRSGSILSRAREIAKATIGRRSVSRSGGAASAVPEPQAAQEAEPRQQQASPHSSPPPVTQKPPLPQPLVDLERSPRARSPRHTKPDESHLLKQKALPAIIQARVPAPPRRSSSLNSLPPDMQAVWPIEAHQQPPHQQQHQHQLKRQQQHCQPPAGSLSSRFQSTENCLKTVLSAERHQLTLRPPPPSQSQPQPALVSRTRPQSTSSSAASSAATADLPSDASLPSDVEIDGDNCDARGIKAAAPNCKAAKGAPKPSHFSAYATTDMDVRLSELDEDTVTKVTELADDETGFFNNTSDIISTSAAADWTRHLATSDKSLEASGRTKIKRAQTFTAAPPQHEPEADASVAAGAAGVTVAEALPAVSVVRQRKLQLPPANAAFSAAAASLAPSTSSAGVLVASAGVAASKPRHHRRRRQPVSGRKTLPSTSGGRHQHHQHTNNQHQHQHQQNKQQQQQKHQHQHQHQQHQSISRYMFSDSSDRSSGCCEPQVPVNAEEAAKAAAKAPCSRGGGPGSSKLQLVSGVKETEL